MEIQIEIMSLIFKNIKHERKYASFHYFLFFKRYLDENFCVVICGVLLLLLRIISLGKHILLNLVAHLQEKNNLPFRSQRDYIII